MTRNEAISKKIESKKLVPIDNLLWALDEFGEYCGMCEADEPMLIDMSGVSPAIWCPCCENRTPLDVIIKKAQSLPSDFSERMIKTYYGDVRIEQVGDDTWITNGYVCELAGDRNRSYPDRDEFKKTEAISKALSFLATEEYEEAKLSRKLYRTEHGDRNLAILESQNHTVYMDNCFTKFIGGTFTPYVCDPQKPIMVKAHGKTCRIIMPVRVKPEELRCLEGGTDPGCSITLC